MSIIMRMLGAPTIEAASPLQDAGWWGEVGSSAAGVNVGPDSALKISTVYACVSLLAETIAGLPLVLYRWMEEEEGRERARNHPLYSVLHDQPNDRQTAFEFVQMMMTHALMRGSGYAEIVPGPRGFADKLVPIHPDRIRGKELLVNGRLRYQVMGNDGKIRPRNQEDIFEIGGMSLDGVNTLSVINHARESLGLALAAEKFGGNFYRNDSRPGGVLQTPGKLTEKAGKRLKAQWEAAHSGINQNRVAVLEDGMEWKKIGLGPEEAQFLGTREFQAEDICRWFRVPPHMVGLTSKSTSWGSGIEQMSLGFVTYTLRPWLTRWSQAIQRDLILAKRKYFADFVLEALLKGDIGSRYNAYAIGRQWGWLSVNDIRRLENQNPIGNGNVYLSPLNMNEAGRERASSGGSVASNQDHYLLLAEEAAGRLIRKEMAAIRRASATAADNEAWKTAVSDFYSDHAALVAQTMRITLETAVAYCTEQKLALYVMGTDGMSDWETRRAADLARLAIGAAIEEEDG